MPLDNEKYLLLIDKIKNAFSDSFGKDMIFVKGSKSVTHMGHFELHYKYLPLGYNIRFTSDLDVFEIDIFDEEGAKNSLYRIEAFDSVTTIDNVTNAVKKLKCILFKNDFPFYISQNGKLYRKENHQYKRVKDWITELVPQKADGMKKL